MSDTIIEKAFSAQEARKSAEGSSWLINHMIKEIRNAATQNRTKIAWYLEDCDPKAEATAKQRLIELGYTVQNDDEDNNTIHISW